MPGFVVERYWPGVTEADVRGLNRRLDGTAVGGVRFLGSILVVDDEVVLFEFEAIDRAQVDEVSARAGLRCDRIVAARYLDASPDQLP